MGKARFEITTLKFNLSFLSCVHLFNQVTVKMIFQTFQKRSQNVPKSRTLKH